MSPQNEPRQTKAQRQSAARERARVIREQQRKRERRNRMFTIWGIVAAVAVIAVVIGFIVANGIRGQVADSGPRPANTNAWGGVTLTKPNELAASPASGEVNVKDTQSPTASASVSGAAQPVPHGVEKAAAGKPAQIVIAVDLACPVCKNFEATYADQLDTWMKDGKATVEYRLTGLLDGSASTTNYSSRGANAAYCVANSAPTKLQAFLTSAYEQQPEEGGEGLSNDKLKEIASGAGASDVGGCIDDGTYRPFVKYVTDQGRADGVTGTPTVFVDGQRWSNSGDFTEFAQKIIDVRK
ncbi:hypothetical protein GCM10011512_16250 [Tersicoccus solisilvae]|uniref:Thioredoxin-like fold domain-containing protein n=1 Tax=Tersicoccus solisilvae TaxID=1882339 RepID=A0ABQ1PAD1_9MICC|nr:thioredoxin domain-containing protein [Tersicoccus solisilvae]GGC90030.1 hypothetical protein GCM10011512_16250 [Tersicoccus solisilvae]